MAKTKKMAFGGLGNIVKNAGAGAQKAVQTMPARQPLPPQVPTRTPVAPNPNPGRVPPPPAGLAPHNIARVEADYQRFRAANPNPGRVPGAVDANKFQGNLAALIERKPIGLGAAASQRGLGNRMAPAMGNITRMLGMNAIKQPPPGSIGLPGGPGGKTTYMKKGGKTASKRADGIAVKGKTRGKLV